MEASLTLVHVVPSTAPADLTHLGVVMDEKRLLKHAKNYIEQFRAREIPDDLPGENLVVNGAPSDEICKLARAFDLIVIATHGRSGLKHLWVGSTAEKVVRYSPCPVLTVREYPNRVLIGDGNPVIAERILVPTDFSHLSKGAVTRAVSLAKRYGAKLDLLHVIESPQYPEFGYAHIPMKEAGLRQLVEADLTCWRKDIPGLKELINETLVRTGSVSFEILQAALLLNTDLIIMATHARKGLKHLALGSNAEKVLRHARCPVLIFPARK
jgi:nucleotide-binding universal stress UspA family protein